jgi:hypothetical protein
VKRLPFSKCFTARIVAMCFQFGAKVGKVLEMKGWGGLLDGAAGGAEL